MKNPAASSGVSFNGKSILGALPSNPHLPFITAASGAVFWLFPHKDKVRVRFVKNFDRARNGQTVYSFKPSSPLCYIAFNFVQQILQTVVDSPDVSFQQVIVTEHLADNELTIVIDKEK